MTLSKDDQYYDVKLSAIKTEIKEALDTVEPYIQKKKKKKKKKRKRTLVDYLDRQEEAYKNNRVRSMIDFDEEQTSTVKSVAVEKKMKREFNNRVYEWKNADACKNFSSEFRV